MDFPTLSVNPSVDFGESEQLKTLRSPTEDGYAITRPQWTKSKKSWRVTYRLLSGDDYKTLRNFFAQSAKGASLSFNWTNPADNTTYVVRFKNDTLQASYVAYDRWNVEFELEEV